MKQLESSHGERGIYLHFSIVRQGMLCSNTASVQLNGVLCFHITAYYEIGFKHCDLCAQTIDQMSCKFLRLAFELVEGYLTERGSIETGVCNLSKSRSMAQWETLHSLARSSNTASPHNHRAEIEIDGGYRIEGTHMLISTRPIGLAKTSTVDTLVFDPKQSDFSSNWKIAHRSVGQVAKSPLSSSPKCVRYGGFASVSDHDDRVVYISALFSMGASERENDTLVFRVLISSSSGPVEIERAFSQRV